MLNEAGMQPVVGIFSNTERTREEAPSVTRRLRLYEPSSPKLRLLKVHRKPPAQETIPKRQMKP